MRSGVLGAESPPTRSTAQAPAGPAAAQREAQRQLFLNPRTGTVLVPACAGRPPGNGGARPSKQTAYITIAGTYALENAPPRIIAALAAAGKLAVDVPVPRHHGQARASEYADEWAAAEAAEIASLRAMSTYETVPCPPGVTPIGSQWVYAVKSDERGLVTKLKARIVARGDQQTREPDVPTYAATSSYTSIRTVLAWCAHHRWHIHSMDVSSAYLHARLRRPVYMRAPPGIAVPPGHVLRLDKSLYGLREAGAEWAAYLKRVLLKLGFTASVTEPCVYTRGSGEHAVIVVCYVDDLLVCGPSTRTVESVKRALKDARHEDGQGGAALDIKDLGVARSFLNVEIARTPDGGVWIGQGAYVDALVKSWLDRPARRSPVPCTSTPKSAKAAQADSAPLKGVEIERYQSLLGALLHVALGTRPDTAYAVGFAARHAASPTRGDWERLQRLLAFLAGSSERGIEYRAGAGSTFYTTFSGYCDSSYADDPTTTRSTSGIAIMLASGAIAWGSRRQAWVALSTCEAELNAATELARELMWVRDLLGELAHHDLPPTPLKIDNQSAQAIVEGGSSHRATRHLMVRKAFLRDQVQRQIIKPEYVKSAANSADAMTKALPSDQLETLSRALGLVSRLDAGAVSTPAQGEQRKPGASGQF